MDRRRELLRIVDLRPDPLGRYGAIVLTNLPYACAVGGLVIALAIVSVISGVPMITLVLPALAMSIVLPALVLGFASFRELAASGRVAVYARHLEASGRCGAVVRDARGRRGRLPR